MLVLTLQPHEDDFDLSSVDMSSGFGGIHALGIKLGSSLTKVINLPGKMTQENFLAVASLTKASESSSARNES